MEIGQTIYSKLLVKHLKKFWKTSPKLIIPRSSDCCELPQFFRVLEFKPTKKREYWVYISCGMADRDKGAVELFIASPTRHDGHADLLGAVAHYHLTDIAVGLNHTVNFGVPWLEGSLCSHGLISLPYLDGPKLEQHSFHGETVRCLWLIPITVAEKKFANKHGVEALEAIFDSTEFNYLNPIRKSVV